MIKDHVDSNNLGPLLNECPICLFNGPRQRVALLQRTPDVWMLQCPSCHGASAERMPTDEFLAKLYAPETYIGTLISNENLSRKCAKNIVKNINFNRTGEPFKVLDYGGGSGTLARMLVEEIKSTGYKGDVSAVVVDLFPEKSTDIVSFITPDDFFKGHTKYDLVVASAVLEHLTNVREVIFGLVRSMNSNGFLYARTPFELPLHKLSNKYQIRWPRHLHDLGSSFWETFTRTFGVNANLILSQPSIVETDLKNAPLRTIVAHVLKSPSYFEVKNIRPYLKYKGFVWNLVGGWEAFIQLNDSPNQQ